MINPTTLTQLLRPHRVQTCSPGTAMTQCAKGSAPACSPGFDTLPWARLSTLQCPKPFHLWLWAPSWLLRGPGWKFPPAAMRAPCLTCQLAKDGDSTAARDTARQRPAAHRAQPSQAVLTSQKRWGGFPGDCPSRTGSELQNYYSYQGGLTINRDKRNYQNGSSTS